VPAPYIRDAQALAAYCAEWARESSLALDIEFRRERTYRAHLELIQVATPAGPAIVDPLAVPDLTPLYDLIANPAIEKILHAGSQDMEIYYAQTGRAPQNVFDTQIAAALIGLGDQIGYADLLWRILGVRIAKLETRTDWGQRPLTPGQIAYALDDVRYLHALRERLGEKLAAKGRAAWLAEELAHYEDPATYEADPHRLALRMPRVRSLNRRGLAVLVELAAWREVEAEARDEPRGYIVSDSLLVEIARRAPKRPEDLSALRGLHPRLIERSGRAIIAAVAAGLARSESEVPDLPPARADDPEGAVTLDLLEVFVRHRALEAEIAPRYLCTRQDLADLMETRAAGLREDDQLPLRSGWRHELVGEGVEAILEGRLDLGVDARTGRVTLRKRG
jgi:ribonuclease D